jgi:two-component system LytT family response regulator
MKIRALIVDNEEPVRARVAKLLASEPDVEVVGQCANGLEAIGFIQKHRTDLVFLEVRMPEVDGFEILRALPTNRCPEVIFVTAHEEYALAAFEFHALDYLIKPFKEGRFRDALQQARHYFDRNNDVESSRCFQKDDASTNSNEFYSRRLAIKSGEYTAFVEVADVDYIEAAANYAILHVGVVNHILRETLTNLEAKLSPERFLRVNRSTIVNLDRIKAVHPAGRGEHSVVLKNGKKITLTRGVREVQRRLECL